MMTTIKELLRQIAQLEPGEQVELAEELLTRLEKKGWWPPRRRPAAPVVQVTVLFDGGSLGNPGPGYGSFILSTPRGKQVHRRLDFGRTMTSNEAEYAALIAALEEAHHLLQDKVTRVALELRGDSMLVAQQVQGRWKAHEPRMRVLRDRVLELLRPFRSWRYVRVPRQEVAARLGH